MSSLQGKKIIVTGGSRGIGEGIVRYLDELGAQIAFSFSSRSESAQKVLDSLKGQNHKIFQLNISSEESIDQGIGGVLKEWGGIDGLVNNAGITRDQLLLRTKTEDFDAVINTNLRGTFLCSKAVIKPMMRARQGSIVNIVSVIGQTGNAGQVNYAASKAGTEAMSKSIALELASRGIRSNCIAPGFIASEMTDKLSEEQQKQILEKIPLGTIGEPKDIATAVAFLLSQESKYITGHTLNVNGGMYMN